jgi:uncharacterized membrane protein YtjA (UPF0391 family)
MYWAGVFFALAMATGLFAFSGIATGASGAAQIVFVVCLLVALLALLGAYIHRRD